MRMIWSSRIYSNRIRDSFNRESKEKLRSRRRKQKRISRMVQLYMDLLQKSEIIESVTVFKTSKKLTFMILNRLIKMIQEKLKETR
jgi:hypothetical protein